MRHLVLVRRMVINLPLLRAEGMEENQGKKPQEEPCNLKANTNYAIDSGFSLSLRKEKWAKL